MRKQYFGKQLSRDVNERKALFKGLINTLVMRETITTTEAKAHAVRAQAEKLVTKAKRKGESAHMILQSVLTPVAITKVISDLSKRFADRPGGYTRIIKLGQRFGDGASMAVLEWIEKKEPTIITDAKKSTKKVSEKKTVEQTVAVEKKASTKKTSVKKETKEKTTKTKSTKKAK